MKAPSFAGGLNVAMKLPQRVYADTVDFYRNALGLTVTDVKTGARVSFGAVTLHLDRVPSQSQTDIWLEVTTSDTAAARDHLAASGIPECREVEALPDGFDGFWIAAPSGTIHLVSADSTPS